MMDELLKRLLNASGVSGHEHDVAAIMQEELAKSCDEVKIDNFGNVIARKGSGKLKIMLAAHMDEIGLLVKHVTKEGFIHFIKIGGVDDRILLGQRVVIKAAGGDVMGLIGAKPPHLTKEEERKRREEENARNTAVADSELSERLAAQAERLRQEKEEFEKQKALY